MMRNSWIFVSLMLVLPSIYGQTSQIRFWKFTRYVEFKTWADARSFCQKNHTDLVTIKSVEEDLLIGQIGYWMGLYQTDNGSPWKWASDETTLTYSNWKIGEPKPDQHCAGKANGIWSSDKCEVVHTFTCFDEQLILVKENKTWDEALDHCRSLGGENSVNPITNMTKYDLVTLITDDDHNYARDRAQAATTNAVWTGLRFLGDAWYWVGGEMVQYQNMPSCPTSRCGVMERDSNTLYGTRDCSKKRNFFCYKIPPNN